MLESTAAAKLEEAYPPDGKRDAFPAEVVMLVPMLPTVVLRACLLVAQEDEASREEID